MGNRNANTYSIEKIRDGPVGIVINIIEMLTETSWNEELVQVFIYFSMVKGTYNHQRAKIPFLQTDWNILKSTEENFFLSSISWRIFVRRGQLGNVNAIAIKCPPTVMITWLAMLIRTVTKLVAEK